MTIRTAHLAGPIVVTNVASVLYTALGGQHVRVRTIIAVNSGTVNGVLSLAIGDVLTASNRFLDRRTISFASGATTKELQLAPDQVLEEGETLQAVTTIAVGAVISVLVSGTIYDN